MAWVGPASGAPAADAVLDAAGRAAVPGFVDSHSHLVFAGDRAAEFEARMSGRAYAAGGIRMTVTATRAAGDEQLATGAARLAGEMLRQGTTTIEVKSGYGLTVADERRSLAVAQGLTPETTFLGAHVVPAEYAGDVAGYVDLVTGPMMAACAPHARWVDVFVEDGAFDADAARAVLAAGVAAGLGVRVHAASSGRDPGRCWPPRPAPPRRTTAPTSRRGRGRPARRRRRRHPVARSGVLDPFALSGRPGPARRRGVGRSRHGLQPGHVVHDVDAFVIALAVREMRMTPAEALHAATAGGAAALRRPDVGMLRPGARADVTLLDAPSFVHLAYRPGVPLVSAVIRAGRRIV